MTLGKETVIRKAMSSVAIAGLKHFWQILHISQCGLLCNRVQPAHCLQPHHHVSKGMCQKIHHQPSHILWVLNTLLVFFALVRKSAREICEVIAAIVHLVKELTHRDVSKAISYLIGLGQRILKSHYTKGVLWKSRGQDEYSNPSIFKSTSRMPRVVKRAIIPLFPFITWNSLKKADHPIPKVNFLIVVVHILLAQSTCGRAWIVEV